MRWKVTVAVCVVCAVLGFFGGLIANRDVKGTPQNKAPLSDKAKAAEVLDLLTRNNITNPPRGFNFWSDEAKIHTLSAADSSGELFTAVSVEYPVEYLGVRGCSFILNSDKKCILWHSDSAFTNAITRQFVDLTGDGHLEKMLISSRDSDTGHKPAYTDKFQVFTLSHNSGVLLLDVDYNAWLATDDFYSVNVAKGTGPTGLRIGLASDNDPGKDVYFTWSADDKRFIVDGKPSKNWHVGVSGPQSEVTVCPFHPDQTLEGGRACPICGYSAQIGQASS